MNKRLNYLLVALLTMGSCTSVYAQSPYVSVQPVVHRISRVTTGPILDTTTRPVLDITTSDILTPKVTVNVGPTSITTGQALHISDFDADYVPIKVCLEDTELIDPKTSAGSLASYIDHSINLKAKNAEEAWRITASLYVYNAREFMVNIKPSEIQKDSISSMLTFTIPGSLLTTNEDITVTIPVQHTQLMKPEISVQSGTYSYISHVALSCSTVGAEIRYTLDGSDVTEDSPLYIPDIPLSIDHSCTLKVASFKDGQQSETVSADYYITGLHITPSATVQVSANSITTGSKLHLSDFKEEYVSILVTFPDTAFVSPKYTAGSAASYIASSINLKANNPDNQWRVISSLYVNSATEFVVNIKTSELENDIIPNTLRFTIPGSLLTTHKNVTISIPVVKYSSNSSSSSSSSKVHSNKQSTEATQPENDNTLVNTPDSTQNATTSISNDSTTQEPPVLSDTVTTLIKTQKRELSAPIQIVSYGLKVNNKEVDLGQKLLNNNGRILVPIRTLCNALNVPLQYDHQTKTITLTNDNKTIELPLGYNVAVVNGTIIPLDASHKEICSTVENNKAYLPVRFIAEQLDLNISFEDGILSIYEQ